MRQVATLGAALLLTAGISAEATGDEGPKAPPGASGGGEAAPASFAGIEEVDLAALLDIKVTVATKSELAAYEAPAIVTVISQREIRQWGYRSVDELLRHVVGVYVIDDLIIPNVGIRGTSGGFRSESGLVKVMIDGHAVAFRPTAGNWLGPELLPLSAVQQVEIVRGPASALYGADAFLGVINVVTRSPKDLSGGHLSLSGIAQGSGGATLGRNVTGVAGAMARGWQVMATFGHHRQDLSGLQLPANSPAPNLPGYAAADRRSRDLLQGSNVAFVKGGYTSKSNHSITVAGWYSEIDRGAEFADWAQLTHGVDGAGNSNGTRVSLRQGMVNVVGVLRAGSTVDLTLDGQFFAGGPTGRDRIEIGSDLYYVRRQFGYRGMDLEAEIAWRPTDTVSLLGGAGILTDDESLPVAKHVIKTGNGMGQTIEAEDRGRVSFRNPGAHLQVMWSPKKRWGSVLAGVRYDQHNIYGPRLSTRVGSVLALSRLVHLKMLYGNAFKAPSPQLLYGYPLAPGDIMGNPGLKPSQIHTAETQVIYQPSRQVSVTTGLAYNYLMDQAEFALEGFNQVARNVAKSGSWAWESELRFEHSSGASAYTNLAVNRTVHNTGEKTYAAMVGSFGNAAYPMVIANGGVSSPLPRVPLRLGLEFSYVSARRASRSNAVANRGLYELNPYFLMGGTLRTVGLNWLGNRETSIGLIVRNLLGTRIADPGFSGVDYPQPARSFVLEVTQEW